MDLSNSSWMTTNGRFRQVSWKADERVRPPHPLSSEPPPDREPQFSCADTKGISSSAHPPPGPQRWAQAHETHTAGPGRWLHTHHTTSDAGGSGRPLEQGWGQGCRGGGSRQGRSWDSTASGRTSPLHVPRLCGGSAMHLTGSRCPGPGPRSPLLTPFLLSWDKQRTLLKSGTGLPTESVTQRVTNIPCTHSSEAALPPVPRAPAPGPPHGRVQAPTSSRLGSHMQGRPACPQGPGTHLMGRRPCGQPGPEDGAGL